MMEGCLEADGETLVVPEKKKSKEGGRPSVQRNFWAELGTPAIEQANRARANATKDVQERYAGFDAKDKYSKFFSINSIRLL